MNEAGIRDSVVDSAVTVLSEGGLVVHPTETVYGIGARVDGPGVDHVREAKGRGGRGFVVLVPGTDFARPLLGSRGTDLAEAFWPGPLTLVCDDHEDRFPGAVKAEDGSVAVRVCGNPLTREMVARAGCAIISTSANAPGGTPARTLPDALEACRALGLASFGVDGGVLPGLPPSTLVDVRRDRCTVLRNGAVALEELRRAGFDEDASRASETR